MNEHELLCPRCMRRSAIPERSSMIARKAPGYRWLGFALQQWYTVELDSFGVSRLVKSYRVDLS